MRKIAIIAGVALGIAVAGCSAAPPPASRPVARTATAAAAPSATYFYPEVCGTVIPQLRDDMNSAMGQPDDGAMLILLMNTTWPAGFQGARQMELDIESADVAVTKSGRTWDGVAMNGSPASTSSQVRADMSALGALCQQ